MKNGDHSNVAQDAFPAPRTLLQCPLVNNASMKLLLPLKYINEQDRRALALYLAIALLSAILLAAVMLFAPASLVGRKADPASPSPASPQPTARQR